MRNSLIKIFLLLLLWQHPAQAQSGRIQYPPALRNSFVGVNIGYINYNFSSAQLEPGFNVSSVRVPHTAVKIILAGHQFNKYLFAQISYLRPVNWVEYQNINADGAHHTVWMNVVGLTVASQLPLSQKISLSAEAGLGIITRKGFSINHVEAVKNANYATVLTGALLQYHLSDKWNLVLSGVWSPTNKKEKQPQTIFFSGGFTYAMRKLPDERVKRNTDAGFIFPKQLLQLSYTTNGWGYGVNKFVSKGAIPIFWGGDAKVSKGFSVNYQCNIFHTRKVFALDWGASAGFWKSKKNGDEFFTFSLYPVLRFTALRTKPLDLYFNYSVAGPSFISAVIIDSLETGKKFTFQDFMGMGVFAGKKRKWNAELKIAHFSNGNIYPRNAGVMVPLSFTAGITF